MPAVNTSSTPNPMPAMPGVNFAPLKPLKEMSENDHSTENTLCQQFQTKYNEYRQQNSGTWREYLEIGRMISNCRSGKYLMNRHALDKRWVFTKKDSRFDDRRTVAGQFQFYSTKLDAEWLSSKPDLDPICPSDDDQIEEFISAVKIQWDHYNTKFFDDDYELLESRSAQDFGTWITRYRFDPTKNDIVCELLDFTGCKWDLRFKAEESPYFIYESKCSKNALEHLLKREVPEGDNTEHYGLQVQEQIASQGGSVYGQGQDRPRGVFDHVNNEVVVTEMWLQPEAYCEIDLKVPEETWSGQQIKGSLLEMFPNGMVVVGINGMQKIIGIYAEQLKDHIVSGIYHLQSYTGVGKGISDAVDLKRERDKFHSQIMAYLDAHGTPAYAYESNTVTEQQVRQLAKPRAFIPIDLGQAPDGVNNVNQVIQPILPGNPAQGMLVYGEQLSNFFQMAFQVTNFSNGMPGVDNKTARGAVLGDENAQKMLVPQHRNKASHRRRSAVVIYNLFKKYVDKPKFFATKDKNGITKGKYLSGNDFADVDIDFEIVANSEIPQTPFAQKESVGLFLQQTGGVAGLIQAVAMNPELTGEIASAFGAKLSIPSQKDIARVCRQRIEQSKQLLQQEYANQELMAAMGIQPDNTNLPLAIVSQLKPPIHPSEPYHAQKVQWLSELLDNDEFMFASPDLRAIISEMMDTHIKMQTWRQAEVQQDQNLAAISAELPMLLGQQAMDGQNQAIAVEQQQAQMQQQQQMEAQKVQQGLEVEKQKAEIQEKQAQGQRDHEVAMNERQHGQALQLNAIQALAQQEKQPKK